MATERHGTAGAPKKKRTKKSLSSAKRLIARKADDRTSQRPAAKVSKKTAKKAAKKPVKKLARPKKAAGGNQVAGAGAKDAVAKRVRVAAKEASGHSRVGNFGKGFIAVREGVLGLQFPAQFVPLQAIANSGSALGLVVVLNAQARQEGVSVEVLTLLAEFIELHAKVTVMGFGTCCTEQPCE